jgi:hypothetical protein
VDRGAVRCWGRGYRLAFLDVPLHSELHIRLSS